MYRLQYCTELPSPPDAVGMKSGFAAQFSIYRPINYPSGPANEKIEDVPPQLKSFVVLGLQYAALAKYVKGVNDEICAELRAVMLCLLEGWTSPNPGAALTIGASRKGKMKPANNILIRGWVLRIRGCKKRSVYVLSATSVWLISLNGKNHNKKVWSQNSGKVADDIFRQRRLLYEQLLRWYSWAFSYDWINPELLNKPTSTKLSINIDWLFLDTSNN